MYKIILFIFLLGLSFKAQSQNFDNLSFGTDSTLEVLTWNIEWFPKNGTTTKNLVRDILIKLNVDVIAIQEVDDLSVFEDLLSEMPGYGFDWETSYFAGLAYIYNPNTIELIDYREIYTSSQYWNAFPRSPKILEFKYKGNPVIVINNHWKCCGDGFLNVNDTGDEENRRLMAANLLKYYIDENYPDTRVILTGDLNDILTDDSTNNVFRHFLSDPDYRFADQEIAEGPSNGWSYPSWPSHLDHFLINAPVFDDFNHEASECKVIRIEEYFSSWSAYDSNVSDHRPVGLKLYLPEFITIEENSVSSGLTLFPNPARQEILLRNLSAQALEFVQIFDQQGKLILQFEAKNQTEIKISLTDIQSGLYYLSARFQNNLQQGFTFVKSE